MRSTRIVQPHTAAVGLLCGTLLLMTCAAASLADAVDPAAPTHEGKAMPDLNAQRAQAWSQGESQFLLLENDVRLRMGGYGFSAQAALVRIERDEQGEGEDGQGQAGRKLTAYLIDAQPHAGEALATAQASELLVTGSAPAGMKLRTDLLRERDQRPEDARVDAGLERMAQRDASRAQAAMGQDERLAQAWWPFGGDEDQPDDAEAEQEPEQEVDPADTVLPTAGVVRFAGERVVYDDDEPESRLMLIGNVRLMYEDHQTQRTVSLRAGQAVVFLDVDHPTEAGTEGLDAQAVRGIYLEDHVTISDGDLNLRSPRMFFDVAGNRAVVLDAVLYTFDVQTQVPLYVRAELVRQQARRSFEAENAILTTSEFAVPHVAIGAGRVTLDQTVRDDATTRNWFTARHVVPRVQGVPVAYWPYVAGDPAVAGPLRSISGGFSTRRGPEVETEWDVFGLLGFDAPEGVDLTGNLDYRGESGPGIGLGLDYDVAAAQGTFAGYFLGYDRADDRLGDRDDVEQDGTQRGYARWWHRQPLQENWELTLQGAYVSDETFLESYFRDEAYTARPYETSAYLLHQQSEWAADLYLSMQTTDFIPQLTTLQSPGLAVERMPELGYWHTGTSLFWDTVTWYSENRLSRLRAFFGNDRPEDRGFTDEQAGDVFGIDADRRFSAAAEDAGFDELWRLRADTRQELTLPLETGPLDVTPYVVGRATGYDRGFDDDFSDESRQSRLWGGAGTRLGTRVYNTFDGVRIGWLDVDRLRHIIEPGVDVFYMESTVDAGDWPTYDRSVEGIDQGSGLRMGVRNTLQTQRGGPGRWRHVDWITLDMELVLRDGAMMPDAPLPRYYRHRPELSWGGDHVFAAATWRATEAIGLSADATHSLERHETDQWRVGARLDHTPRLSSFVNYRDIHVLERRLVNWGADYQLTRKYSAGFTHQIDARAGRSRNLDLELQRRLPQARLILSASFDHVDDEQSFGISLRPKGLGGLVTW